MLIDTHCHMSLMVRTFQQNITFAPFSTEELHSCEAILQQAQKKSVTTILNVGTNLVESLLCIEIAKHFSNCYATIGLHPNDATADWKLTIQEFSKLLNQKQSLKIIGIGECGIDKHYPDFNLKQQQDVFHAQIQLALQHNLALVIHSRDADMETYEALEQYRGEKNFKGTIHCFSSNETYAEKYLDLGFVLGIGGTVTYPKNETLRNVVKMVPIEKIIFETDAPFLPPQTMRGQKNNPSNIREIAEFVAQLKNIDLQTVMHTTTQTATQLFGLPTVL